MTGVTIINTNTETSSKAKLRCAAYCRVSSSSEDQLNSYTAQIRYYSRLFEDSDTEELIDIYADEGITGTSAEKREEFKRLIADCKKGRVDRIYTKSISRYARNTKECLESIRLLRALGVSIIFEKENIDTANMSDEMMITIMGGLAQEESTSISQNQRWSVKKRMQNGTYETSSVPFGYIKENNTITIDNEKAKIVKMIYNDYLSGLGIEAIVRKLNEMGISNGKEGCKWYNSAIEYILTNEKYIGNTLLQKSYSTNSMPIRRCVNKGEREQYLINNTHRGIISEKEYNKVQEVLSQKRELYYKPTSYRSILSEKIHCRSCGTVYKRRVKSGKTYWVCAVHNKDIEKCSAPPIPEKEVTQAFISLSNKLILHYREILIPLQRGLNELRSIKFVGNNKVMGIHREVADLKEQKHIIARLRKKGFISDQKYNEQLASLDAKLKRQEKELKRIAQNDSNDEMIEQLDMLISCIEKQDDIFSDFDTEFFDEIVDNIIVHNSEIIFRLVSGIELCELL